MSTMNQKTHKKTIDTRTIAFCALLAAISVALARMPGLSITPTPNDRWSFDKFPIFLSGVLFGPICGCLVGVVADTIGAVLFSPFGFNPLFCVIPVLYGLFGGLLRRLIARKYGFLWIIAGYLPAIILGSILSYSAIIGFTSGSKALFLAKLVSRSIQFAIVGPIEILITCFMLRSRVFRRIGIWPPTPKKKKEEK